MEYNTSVYLFNPLLRVHTLYRSMSVMLLEVTVFRPP